MRQQRAQRMSTTTPVFRSGTDLPASGFAMLVDGRVKREFNTEEAAVKAATDLKGCFPMLQSRSMTPKRSRARRSNWRLNLPKTKAAERTVRMRVGLARSSICIA